MIIDRYDKSLILAMAAALAAVHLANGARSTGAGRCADPDVLCLVRERVDEGNPLLGMIMGPGAMGLEAANLFVPD